MYITVNTEVQMRKIPQEKIDECIRLRVEERLSIEAVRRLTGLSKGSVSKILKPYPLTKQEVQNRNSQSPWNKGVEKYDHDESYWHQMATGRGLDANGRSKVAEAAVLFRMCVNGISVWGSPFDGEKADWLAQTDKGIFKIQVKTTTKLKHGMPVVRILSSSKKKRYLEGDFDFLIGYDLYADVAYVWAWDELTDYKTCVTISKESAERWDKIIGA
jgi:hypothetical protein